MRTHKIPMNCGTLEDLRGGFRSVLRVLNDQEKRVRWRLVAFIHEIQEITKARPRTYREKYYVAKRAEKLGRARFSFSSQYDMDRGHYWDLDIGWSPTEFDYCYTMLALLGIAGNFWRLAECDTCHRWYIRSRRWQQSCSTKCRKTTYRSKPEVMARNRRYMRKYYKEWLRSDRNRQKRRKRA
jgi:hypothetical protein